MRLLLTILFCASTLAALAQPFAIGRQTITLTDPARSNRSIPSEIFYPATSAGNNTPVATGNFPVIVFGHGFSMNYDAYENFWDELVPQGYILAFPKTEIGPIPFPAHEELAADMNYTITWFIAENNASASRYFNKVSGKFAVMGHSMGGGCSYIAAATNPNVTVIANYAAAETNPSAIAAAANITIPALIFAGSKDCVAGPSGNQTPMYNALASACKSYVTITDGSHCQFGESNTLCNFGETTSCPFTSYISRGAQHTKTFQYLNPFLGFYLKGDCSAWPVYQQLLANPTGATVQNSCSYQLPVAAITVNGSTSICQGDTTQLIAGGNYTNLWTGGSTQQQLSVVQGGTYELIVTDNIGCKDTASQAIQQTTIQVQASILNANCGSNDGEATLTSSGGAAPYSFAWPNGETTATVTGLAGGTYQVTVTDDGGCSTSYTVSINAPGSLAVSIATIGTTCPNNSTGSAVATVSGGTAPYSYSWQGSPSVIDTATGFPAGQFQLTITDDNGCNLIDTFTITAPDTLAVSIATVGTTCPDDSTGSAVATVSGGTAPYSYSWQGSPSVNDAASGFPAGQFQLTITDNNGCNLIDSFDITSPILWSPTIVSLSGTELCEGDTTVVVPIDNYSEYIWSTGDTTPRINVTQSGFYNCTVLDGSGCYVPGVGVNVTFFEDYLNPEIEQSGDSLYITEGTVVAWFVDGTAVSGATDNYILNPTPGGYYAQVIDTNGCYYIAKSYSVISSISEQDAFAQISVYPNPSNGNITITGLPTNAEWYLTDVLGKTYAVESIANTANGTVRINAGELPAQMYLLQVVSGESRYICKVFITQ